ncbi:TadE/TadG family type IV pilus assembly protein [Aestuariivirga litoralis]|uniref:TadE/TadG family type IV pilus assembly protein n=1 Tax=Aestuariivirga litoralis TaxID=2650924 RepID=UPI0018C6B7D2|nr:pilus assembly protein TadG-related protein [Aestuariivirga litoralis]
MSIILGLSIIPLIVCAGAAVDYERAINARTQLAAALDSATLYAASYSVSNPGSTSTKLTQISQPYITQNYENTGDSVVSNYVAVDNGATVTGSASVKLTTYFLSVVGQTTMSMDVSSTVQKSGINLEVALVLDNTNSMNSVNSKTGNTAITDLRAAAAKFVTTVMPASQGQFYTKIAVVPYNNGVNMGTAAQAVAARGTVQAGTSTNPGYANYQFSTSSSLSANFVFTNYSTKCDNYPSTAVCKRTFPVTNCVTERTGAQAYTDAAMSAAPVGRAYQTSSNGCTVVPIVPLSTDATALNLSINSMLASNSTGGQVGIGWGWYALSPNVGIWSGSSVPSGYDKLTTSDTSKRVRKVMILMTDGEYNSAYCNGVITGNDTANGSSGSPYYYSVTGSGSPIDHINCAPTNGGAYTQSNAMCSAIKASGVEVYVITFQLDKTYPARVALVNNCATDASHVVDADSTSLDAAFKSLANQILGMRIAQ